EMTVTNNGNSALVNIAPSLLTGCAGGATETFVSGPAPPMIPSLSKGGSGVFSWTYRITGAVGQTYCLTGSATANGPVITNTTQTNSGQISVYSVTTAPSVVSSGAANVTINWNVYNGGGCDLMSISIAIPSTAWACSSVTPPTGWQAGCDASLVTFTSTSNSYELAPGETGTFSISFSSVETVTGDKTVAFPVSVIPRGCGGETVTLGSYITVTANSMVLSHTPAGPLYADGSSYYEMTATLTSGGAPLAGKTVTFSTTSGSLSASSAMTDINGQAKVQLISPVSTSNTSSTVTAEYLEAQDTGMVNFLGWAKPNIQYWGGLSPAAVQCGSVSSFTMQLKNIASTSMTLGPGSYFSFNDSASGGSSVFQAYIDSPVTISPGATLPVSFGSPTNAGGGGGILLASSFMAGVYEPAANSTPPPASGLFLTDGGTNDQYRTVSDSVTTGGSCGTVRVRIIDWQEMR
ncbi:MAG: Ig-like domain-containing protein, partial [Deltaproteobacteria bacterium]|nr:Ig-like domain-containing protein [Deltaproteobacteria bacterium]